MLHQAVAIACKANFKTRKGYILMTIISTKQRSNLTYIALKTELYTTDWYGLAYHSHFGIWQYSDIVMCRHNATCDVMSGRGIGNLCMQTKRLTLRRGIVRCSLMKSHAAYRRSIFGIKLIPTLDKMAAKLQTITLSAMSPVKLR